MLTTRPREEWKSDVATRYKALEQFSKEDARVQFLRILRSLPYGAPHLPAPSCAPLQWHAATRRHINLWLHNALQQLRLCALQPNPFSFSLGSHKVSRRPWLIY